MLSTFLFISLVLSISGAVVSTIIWLAHRFSTIRADFDQRNDQYLSKNQLLHSEIKSRLQKVESEQGKYVLHTECSLHRLRLRDAIGR